MPALGSAPAFFILKSRYICRMENVKISPNGRPHLQFKEDGPLDYFAFNVLCVSGSIAGIHAGNKRIFIYQSEMETVNGS